ncbi:hypothetical protein BH11PLA1_BH11PLA1_11340 [soil metagenome]
MLSLELWVAFAALVVVLITLDLALLTRRQRTVTAHEAVASLLVWFLIAYALALGVWLVYEQNWLDLQRLIPADLSPNPDAEGRPRGLTAHVQFLAVYAVELALSLDNIAVLALLYAALRVPRAALPRALFWGTLIALCIRLGLILGAAGLLNALHQRWVAYLFASLLILSLLRLLFMRDPAGHAGERWPIGTLLRRLRVSPDYDGHRLITRVAGRRMLTPLALAVMAAAWADLTCTVDSVPAAFAITREPFIAFAGSALAILSLRSLFFSVSSVLDRLRYLKPALAIIMAALTVKLLTSLSHPERLWPAEATLFGVIILLAAAAAASLPGSGLVLQSHEHAAARPRAIDDFSDAATATRRNARKIAVLIAGTLIILFGIAIGPLPGPGPVIIVPLGFALLATEFEWAKTALERGRKFMADITARLERIALKLPWPVWALIIPLYLALATFLYLALRHDPRLGKIALTAGGGLLFPVGFLVYSLIKPHFRTPPPPDAAPPT